MVSFRLSPEEYRLYRDACAPNGVRTISELARTAMHHLVVTPAAPRAPLDQEVSDLRERLAALTHQVDHLNRRLGATLEKA